MKALLAGVLLVGLLGACLEPAAPSLMPGTEPPRCLEPLDVMGARGFDAGAVLLAGQPVELEVGTSRSVACAQDWTVEAQVFDPLDQPVSVMVTPGRRGPIQPARATIRFMPQTPGAYFVTVRFEPTLELIQQTVQVAQARGGEPPLVDALPFDPHRCTSLARTLSGAVLCGAVGVDVVRGGAVVQQFVSRTASVVGDVVWLLSGNQLDRFIDTGSGPLVPAGSIAAQVAFAPSGFFTEGRAVVSDGSGLRPLRWEGTRLVDERTRFQAPRAFPLDGRAHTYAATTGAAPVCDVEGDGGCRTVNPVGTDGDVLWTLEGPSLAFRSGGLDGLLRGFELSTAPSVEPLEFPILERHTPRFRGPLGEVLTVTLVSGTPLLEAWPPGTVLGPRFARVGLTASSVRWLRR